jgi:hypothetical protein
LGGNNNTNNNNNSGAASLLEEDLLELDRRRREGNGDGDGVVVGTWDQSAKRNASPMPNQASFMLYKPTRRKKKNVDK